MTSIYIAGAWVEQHTRARPAIAEVRKAGLVVSCDWTQAEGDICACGHHRQEHGPYSYSDEWACPIHCLHVDPPRHEHLPSSHCTCQRFNGIGVGGDSLLSEEDRRKYAQADLDGVLSADIVWLLAASDRGACGSWVELGAALAARTLRSGCGPGWPYSGCGPGWPYIVVSGPKNRRTLFTEQADILMATDELALAHILLKAAKDQA